MKALSETADLLRFSTIASDGPASVESWRAYMGEVYFRLDVESKRDDAIGGELIKRSFSDAHLSFLAGDDQRVIRSESLISSDAVEQFCFVFPLRGRFVYRQRGHENEATQGGVYILNAQEAYQVDLTGGPEMLCLTLPSDLMRTRSKSVDDLCGRRDFADPVIAGALTNLVGGCLTASPSSSGHRLQDLCIELAATMISRPSSDGRTLCSSSASDLRRRARDKMHEHYADPTLNVVRIASLCGVPIRTLQHAFKLEGATCRDELLRIRLEAARLGLQRSDDQRIGEIAFACGFADQAYFSTCYKRYFGRSPRDELR